MLSLGLSEIVVIALIAVFVIKPKDLPKIARKVGRFLGTFKEYQNSFMKEINSITRLEADEEKKDKEEIRTDES